MNKINSRRNFVKASALGLGTLTLGTVGASAAEIPDDKKKHIVCVGAHPGDPEFGCGGTLAKYSAAGHRVTLLYLTRGEAYDSSLSHATAAATRTAEAEKACKILGATAVFASQVDGDSIFDNERTSEFTRLLMAQKPDIVLTHWPLDTHKDHQISGVITQQAWAKTGRTFSIYFYEVNTGDETMLFAPTDYVDITDQREKKKSALMAHQSQRPEEVYEGWFHTMEDFRGLEAGVKAAEAFIHLKPKGASAQL